MRNLRIVGDVAGKNQRVGQAGGQIADVLFEPLALIGDREPRAGRGRRLRDRPRDRALVRDADDEAGLTLRDQSSTRTFQTADLITKARGGAVAGDVAAGDDWWWSVGFRGDAG